MRCWIGLRAASEACIATPWIHLAACTTIRAALLTLYGHIKTAEPEQRTIIQQYGDWLMSGLVHLVQRGWAWASWGPAQFPPHCTKCNSPPINGPCTNCILFDVAL